MLVLTRKYQEKIRIGDNITITVLRMKGKAVRLGIEAPTDVPVVRGELTFEVETVSEDSESPTVEIEAAGSGSTRSGRTIARAAGMATGWTTESHPDAPSRGERLSDAKVRFNRVPRDKVADLLPKLASGTAPLRAMMDQRS